MALSCGHRGLDVALQMWLRAVKREIRFTLAASAPSISQPFAKTVTLTSVPLVALQTKPACRGRRHKLHH